MDQYHHQHNCHFYSIEIFDKKQNDDVKILGNKYQTLPWSELWKTSLFISNGT